MTAIEAFALIKSLLHNPESLLNAAVAGWDRPIGFPEMLAMNQYDAWTSKGAKPYPRPWDAKRIKVKKRTATEAHRLLRPHLYKD